LTNSFSDIKFVLTMNEISQTPLDELLQYQTNRVQALVEETIQCCQLQTVYLSKRYSIPQAELRCLLLFQGERYQTVTGIAQKLDVAKSRVTKIVGGLTQKKLVQSIDDPRDARIKLLALTPIGHKKSEEIGAFITELHQKLLLEIDPQQRKTIISALELLRSGMEAVKRQLV
jgi:DNA-binding MarR family transcriptional regulator